MCVFTSAALQWHESLLLYNVVIIIGCITEQETDEDSWDEESCSSEDEQTVTAVEPACKKISEEEKIAKDLLQWVTTFLLIWQTAFNISGRALSALLFFLGRFLHVLAKLSSLPLLAVIAKLFPSSLYQANKLLGLTKDTFSTYVVCGRCYSIYKLSECIGPRRCDYVAFPNHRQRYRRISCNAPLFRRVLLPQGKSKYYQINSYPFKSLRNALERLLFRPGFTKKVEAWRQRNIPHRYMCDMYDGRIWKEHSEFFTHSRSIALMLNLDWFQPFDHTTDSIGAMYLTVVNLPRHERFRKENVILVGLIPSMEHEPSDVNSFLYPLVQELQSLWKGERFHTLESPRYKLTYRAMLLCAACDIPAGRKLCGFKGCTANLGCSRCLKKFPGGIGDKNFSGFNRDSWPPRTLCDHRRHAMRIKAASSVKSKDSIETSTGVKYSALLELSYFNPIRFNIIDPMHNLFLGTAKTVLKDIWLARGIITHSQLQGIQARVNSVVVPPTIGRIPRKIASSFAEFTAEQWKNWTLVYSLFALRDILPTAHYHCWEAFVLACRFLCTTCISQEDLQKADLLLLKFCRQIQELYGEKAITPNMHLHCHLHECIKDYGPIYSFWLFSFERYNGILGDFPTNKKSIEVQLMRRFEKEQELLNSSLPESFESEFSETLHNVKYNKVSKGFEGTLDSQSLVSVRITPPSNIDWQVDSTQYCTFPPLSSTKMLSSIERDELLSVYQVMYPKLTLSADMIPHSVTTFRSCYIGSEKLGCVSSFRTRKYSYILASDLSSTVMDIVPGEIQCLFTHRFIINRVEYANTFCEVAWYGQHSQRFLYGKALQLFSKDFERKSYLPLPRIFSKFAPAFGSIHSTDEHVLFVCPLSRNFTM